MMGSIATTVISTYLGRQWEKTERAKRRAARTACGLCTRNSIPVEYDAGATTPRIRGTEWHYETQGGTWVRHPNAYKKVALSADLTYVSSTLRVVVGRHWLGFAGL